MLPNNILIFEGYLLKKKNRIMKYKVTGSITVCILNRYC